MAHVNVTINGRQFRLACEEGQEEHLLRLAQTVDGKVNGFRGQFGEIGDARLTVMAALTLADELADTTQRIRRVEEQLQAMQDARVSIADREQKTHAAIVAAFNSAAERIEKLTQDLNRTVGSGVALG